MSAKQFRGHQGCDVRIVIVAAGALRRENYVGVMSQRARDGICYQNNFCALRFRHLRRVDSQQRVTRKRNGNNAVVFSEIADEIKNILPVADVIMHVRNHLTHDKVQEAGDRSAAALRQDILLVARENDFAGLLELCFRIIGKRALYIREHMCGHDVVDRGRRAACDDLVYSL